MTDPVDACAQMLAARMAFLSAGGREDDPHADIKIGGILRMIQHGEDGVLANYNSAVIDACAGVVKHMIGEQKKGHRVRRKVLAEAEWRIQRIKHQ